MALVVFGACCVCVCLYQALLLSFRLRRLRRTTSTSRVVFRFDSLGASLPARPYLRLCADEQQIATELGVDAATTPTVVSNDCDLDLCLFTPRCAALILLRCVLLDDAEVATLTTPIDENWRGVSLDTAMYEHRKALVESDEARDISASVTFFCFFFSASAATPLTRLSVTGRRSPRRALVHSGDPLGVSGQISTQTDQVGEQFAVFGPTSRRAAQLGRRQRRQSQLVTVAVVSRHRNDSHVRRRAQRIQLLTSAAAQVGRAVASAQG